MKGNIAVCAELQRKPYRKKKSIMAEGPDKGRAWLVAVAEFVIYMILAGIFRAQGLLFVEFIAYYGIDRKAASLPFSIHFSTRNLIAPVVGILGQKYGTRIVIIVGSILGTVSSVGTFFATSMMWITLIWGVINGFASALIAVLLPVVITQYFTRHITTANGISSSGASIGSFIFPAILELVLNSYGLHGTFLIIAGLIMNTLPAALILKAPPWLEMQETAKNNSKKQIYDLNEGSNEILTNGKKYHDKSLNTRQCDCGIQVDNEHNHDFFRDKSVVRDTECKHNILPRKRSHSYNNLTQMCLYHMKHSTMFPNVSSIGINYKTISSNPDNVFDVNIEYLKLKSDLLFQMLLMDFPNVDVSYKAILLEGDQDDLWHPDEQEVMQEIEDMYLHIQKSLEADLFSNESSKPTGLFLKRILLSGTLTRSKKSENVTAVEKYLKTYKERRLEQTSKIRSLPNMSNMNNEIAKSDYVTTKLKQLCNSNEIRVVSHLRQYNPKDVLKVLSQLRNLYEIYSDLESCDQCYSGFNKPSESVETGEITLNRKISCVEDIVYCSEENVKRSNSSNSFVFHIKTALHLHTKPIFLLICFTRAVFFISYVPVITIIVDFAMDRGMQEADGKFFIGALSLGDVIGGVGLGWITDRGYITLPRYMVCCMIVLSTCIISMPFMYTRLTILGSIMVFGMLQGSMLVRHPVLVAKYLNRSEVFIATGCMDFSSGIIGLLLPFYIGYFRDTLGSYNQIFYINGTLVFISAICWFFQSYFTTAATSKKIAIDVTPEENEKI